MVVTAAPSACTARQVHDLTATPSRSTVHDAALAGVAADLGAGQSDGVAEEVHEQQPGLDLTLNGAAVDADGDRNCHVPSRAE